MCYKGTVQLPPVHGFWLHPGIDPATLTTDRGAIIVAVYSCPTDEVNAGINTENLVLVEFDRIVVGTRNRWVYWRDGREFWKNPKPPQRVLRLEAAKQMEEERIKQMSDNLYRNLSAVFLINSAAFAKAAPVDQTAALAANTGGKNVLFVENFIQLGNKTRLRDRLLAGEDVSMELEFNGIELSSEETTALSAVRPVLERITGMKSIYPWLEQPKSRSITFDPSRITFEGYTCGVATGKKVWEFASKHWANDTTGDMTRTMSFNGYNKTPRVNKDTVTIGCRVISRADVEAAAQHYGWEPNIR